MNIKPYFLCKTMKKYSMLLSAVDMTGPLRVNETRDLQGAQCIAGKAQVCASKLS